MRGTKGCQKWPFYASTSHRCRNNISKLQNFGHWETLRNPCEQRTLQQCCLHYHCFDSLSLCFLCCYSAWLTAGLIQIIMTVTANLHLSVRSSNQGRHKHVLSSSVLSVNNQQKSSRLTEFLTVVSYHTASCPLGRVSHHSINTFPLENAVSTFLYSLQSPWF